MNYYFKDSINSFLSKNINEIFGEISRANEFALDVKQRDAWEEQILVLKDALKEYTGTLFFEFSIPRMGKRLDVLIIIQGVAFVIEFKVGEKVYQSSHIDQVWDYALDLKNFHETSHNIAIAPILVATEAKRIFVHPNPTEDDLLYPFKTNKNNLKIAIDAALGFFLSKPYINIEEYLKGSYAPTPTIIEAAITLYNKNSVKEITRKDASAKNLMSTSQVIFQLIEDAKNNCRKVICFVTGVPGAGKTLVGLNVATSQQDRNKGNRSVYLSGNKPLVDILQEALARDKVERSRKRKEKVTKKEALSAVKSFIQIIHHYRDLYLKDPKSPYDHVAIFDEAQRAWDRTQTIDFMRRKKNISNFTDSEPEFLISCLDRHQDWAVVVCLVGGGQEINKGEAGISEWLNAINNKFPNWQVYISSKLKDREYATEEIIQLLEKKSLVNYNDDLHLSVSMRSFRAEKLSLFIKNVLDIESDTASEIFGLIIKNYPIVLTRDLEKAKKWLKLKARGSERYGLVVSSQAQRLKPLAINVKSNINPINYFLNGKDDIRSSYFLEDAATEFQVQGLELDWTCVVWDGDLRYTKNGWDTYSFKGNKWERIKKEERKKYLINAYRVLLTRARQGMIIVVPEGNTDDHTRQPAFYDPTYNYLEKIGLPVI